MCGLASGVSLWCFGGKAEGTDCLLLAVTLENEGKKKRDFGVQGRNHNLLAGKVQSLKQSISGTGAIQGAVTR